MENPKKETLGRSARPNDDLDSWEVSGRVGRAAMKQGMSVVPAALSRRASQRREATRPMPVDVGPWMRTAANGSERCRWGML